MSTIARLMAVSVDLARSEWDDGYRRLVAEARDPARTATLYAQLDVVLDELRKRVGQTYTLADLARAYAGADDWTREAIAERAPSPGWPQAVTFLEGAAFHLYARGATDYLP